VFESITSVVVFATAEHPMALKVEYEQLAAHAGIPVEFSNWQYTTPTKNKKRTKIIAKEGW
jgi:hypothetical protein